MQHVYLILTHSEERYTWMHEISNIIRKNGLEEIEFTVEKENKNYLIFATGRFVYIVNLLYIDSTVNSVSFFYDKFYCLSRLPIG